MSDAAGQPVAVVGYDGEVYLDTLAEHNLLRVQTPKGACTARFDQQPQADGAIPRIGPLVCTLEARP